jgi:hypothetical protein
VTREKKKKKKDRDEGLFLSFFFPSFSLPHRRKGSFGGEPLRTSMIYEQGMGRTVYKLL